MKEINKAKNKSKMQKSTKGIKKARNQDGKKAKIRKARRQNPKRLEDKKP